MATATKARATIQNEAEAVQAMKRVMKACRVKFSGKRALGAAELALGAAREARS